MYHLKGQLKGGGVRLSLEIQSLAEWERAMEVQGVLYTGRQAHDGQWSPTALDNSIL